jgi:hypothetical protein
MHLIDAVQGLIRQTIGFSLPNVSDGDFTLLHQLPSSDTDLISLVRGFVRAPMVRSGALTQRVARTSKVIAIASAGSHTGCTLIALNLAMELSLFEKSTLLIEANFRAPSIAPILSMRNIGESGSWKKIAPNLALAEITQDSSDQLENFMNKAMDEFDVIIIGDVSPETMDAAAWEVVSKCVNDRAALLVMVAGPRYMPHAIQAPAGRELVPA